METISDRLRRLRLERKMSQAKLAQAAKVSQGTIGNIESGVRGYGESIVDIAAALGVTPEYLRLKNETPSITTTGKWDGNVVDAPTPPLMREYPLISYVHAGEFAECIDTFPPGEADSYHLSPKDLGPRGYLLRVEGDSMTDPNGAISFPNGMMLHVHPDIEAVPGNFVIAKRLQENQATFKQLVMVDGELYLHAINPSWPTKYIKLVEGDAIIGRIKFAGWDL
ncbi:LexA family transcriptional regulator [Comamonas sp.]|uniref:helix-turn-helix domain-containing protein n=1 Tax=Comamonas sp. TaxID=34028 RepID=UPI0028980667|nr:LexA family transcriptional regulator [Comamonas sp.]